jgi:hypothetical protein
MFRAKPMRSRRWAIFHHLENRFYATSQNETVRKKMPCARLRPVAVTRGASMEPPDRQWVRADLATDLPHPRLSSRRRVKKIGGNSRTLE